MNSSASEPVGLYRITGQPPARDALVLLKDPLKRLVGVPGDTIRTTAQGTWVNGRLIPDSGIPAAAPYRPYPFGTFKLAPDQYWTLGQHPLSYDSRYQGPDPRQPDRVARRTILDPAMTDESLPSLLPYRNFFPDGALDLRGNGISVAYNVVGPSPESAIVADIAACTRQLAAAFIHLCARPAAPASAP